MCQRKTQKSKINEDASHLQGIHPVCTPGKWFAPHPRDDAPHPVLGMHPICTPGKTKCTPPESEMHPIYGTLLNLFVIPKRQAIPYGMACLFDSLGGTRKGGGSKAAVKTVRWTVFSPWESPFRFQTHPIGMWIKSEYFKERIAMPGKRTGSQ